MTVIHEGHTGVALFIVLSGFIFIYGSADKKIIYLQFLRNRILRIYPLMITMTIIGISVFPEKFTIDGLICTVLPLQNTPTALRLGSYSSLFWTIAVEFQFYLLFPFLPQWNTDREGTCYGGVFIAGYLSFMHGKENFVLRLFAAIGTISYSIYLTHIIVISSVINHSLFFVFPYGDYSGPLLSSLILVLPVTMIVSCLCYHVVEKPFLTLRRSYLEKMVIRGALSDGLANNPQ